MALRKDPTFIARFTTKAKLEETASYIIGTALKAMQDRGIEEFDRLDILKQMAKQGDCKLIPISKAVDEPIHPGFTAVGDGKNQGYSLHLLNMAEASFDARVNEIMRYSTWIKADKRQRFGRFVKKAKLTEEGIQIGRKPKA